MTRTNYTFPPSFAAAIVATYEQPWLWHREDILLTLEVEEHTQRELAAQMGATESQVSDWLRNRDNRDPSMETRIRMDAALDELRQNKLAAQRMKEGPDV